MILKRKNKRKHDYIGRSRYVYVFQSHNKNINKVINDLGR